MRNFGSLGGNDVKSYTFSPNKNCLSTPVTPYFFFWVPLVLVTLLSRDHFGFGLAFLLVELCSKAQMIHQ